VNENFKIKFEGEDDRLRQWWGPAPARPKPVWSTRRVEHGGQRREAAMGKGLPGGRRQAGNIDYRTEPRRSVAPDRPRRAAPLRGGAAGAAQSPPRTSILISEGKVAFLFFRTQCFGPTGRPIRGLRPQHRHMPQRGTSEHHTPPTASAPRAGAGAEYER
jgi:hypothetical protein